MTQKEYLDGVKALEAVVLSALDALGGEATAGDIRRHVEYLAACGCVGRDTTLVKSALLRLIDHGVLEMRPDRIIQKRQPDPTRHLSPDDSGR